MSPHMFNPLTMLQQVRLLLTQHQHWRPGMAEAITGDLTEFLDRYSPVRPEWPSYDELRTAVERIAELTRDPETEWDTKAYAIAHDLMGRFNRPLEDAKTVKLRDAAEQAATILTDYIGKRTSAEGGLPAGLSPLLGALADLRGALITDAMKAEAEFLVRGALGNDEPEPPGPAPTPPCDHPGMFAGGLCPKCGIDVPIPF